MTLMPADPKNFVQPLGHGVHAIDTGFERARFDAAYLVVHGGRAAFIDTGTALALPRLLAALQWLDLPRDAVDYVIPTHVHLDHAGGAGSLMRELPQAQLLVHPRGARHMIDPTALWQGATAVYGAQAMASAYGSVVPVPEARVRTTHDGMALDLAGRVLSFADTPGHARHHHCIWDETSGGWFTGDSFGISYRELDTAQGAWMLPSATPVQFDPPALRTTIERLLARAPQRMYLTHYGCVDEVQRLGGQLLSLLQEMVLLGQEVRRSPARHEALERGQLDLFARSLAAHGCDWNREQIGQFLAIDLKLNAQGMAVWLDREG